MPAPSAPTSVSIARQGSQIVTASPSLNQYLFAAFDFEWAVVAAVRYRVQWNQGPANGELLGVGVGSKRFTGLQISSVYAAHIFGLQVRAENDSGVSAWTPGTPIDFIAPSSGSGTAATPGSIASSSVKPRSFALSWTSSATNVSCFECRVVGVTVTQNFLLKFASLERAAVVTGLLPAQTYLVEIRAVVGLGTSAGVTGTAASAWSSAITVITSADAIQITAPGGGAVIPVWRTITYNTAAPAFSVITSTNATVRSASGLPGTLAIVGTVPVSTFTIEGNVTAAVVGLYTATINVTDASANTDALSVGVLVRDPSVAIAPAAQNGVVGSALSYSVPWAKIGPITSPATWTLRFAPAFLSIDAAGVITGTPDAPGTYSFEVKASNGTQSDTQPMTLTVAGLAITSASEVTIYQNAALDFTLTANASSATWSALNLPAWLSLVGSKLIGTAANTPADFAIQITASNATDTATQLLTVHVLSILRTETPWNLNLSQPAYQTARYLGTGTVQAWYLTNAPGGLSIGSVGSPSGLHPRASVTGSPTETGFFDVVVTVQVEINHEVYLFTATVQAIVAGALFLPWLHSDPHLFDVQVQVRGDSTRRIVQSYYASAVLVHPARTVTATGSGTTIQQSESAQTESFNFTFKRDDTAKLAILLKDGNAFLSAGISAVKITFREPNARRADEPLLSVSGTLVDLGSGHVYFAATLQVTGDILEAIFDHDARDSISTVAEISWVWSGDQFTALNFPATFIRDERR